MNGIIVESFNKDAVILTDEGLFVKVKNRNYEVGQTVTIKKSFMKVSKLMAGAASMAAVMTICTIGGFAYYTPTDYVSIDVNPSIEYSVNRFDRILDVKAVNDDGAEILADLKLDNMKLENAVKKTMDQLIAEGYLTDENGSVVITTSNDEIGQAKELAAELKQEVQTYLNGRDGIMADVKAEAVGMKRVEEAQKLGVTPGKLNLVEELQKSTSGAINEEEWLNMPVKDIKKAINENRKSSKDQAGQQDENTDQTNPDNALDPKDQTDKTWKHDDQAGSSSTDSKGNGSAGSKGTDSVNTEQTDPSSLPWADNWNNHKNDVQPPRIATAESIDFYDSQPLDENQKNNSNQNNKQNKADKSNSADNSDSSDANN